MIKNLMKYNLNDECIDILHISAQIAKEYHHAKIGPAHLLKCLIKKGGNLRTILQENSIDIYYLEDWADIRLEQYPKAHHLGDVIDLDNQIEAIINEAGDQKHKFNSENITPIILLHCTLLPGVGFTYEQLKSLPINTTQIEQIILSNRSNKHQKSNSQKTNSAIPINSISPYFSSLKNNLNADEIQYNGRTDEVRQIIEIVARKEKSNVLLIGTSGVGKSTLIKCLAQSMQNNELPLFMQDWELLQIWTQKLITGTTYKAEIEDRLQKTFTAIEELQQPTIVCLDDIHLLFDQQQKNIGITSLIKEVVAKGFISIVATTTPEHFRKLIEQDTTFNRNFEKLNIAAPTFDVALQMLQVSLPAYEKYHKLKVDQAILPLIIQLAQRYLYERALPDVAIDLLDRTLAVYKIMNETTETLFKKHTEQWQERTNEEAFYNDFYQRMNQKYTPTLWSRIIEENNFFQLISIEEKRTHIENLLKQIDQLIQLGFEQVEEQDVYAVIAQITGIPIGKVQTDEKERLLNMEKILSERVIGQSIAIKSVTDAILESRSGLIKEGQPIASFFFLGPTGTGKTELAKALAQFLFDDEKQIIRFDMSEFKEEHSAALLYGAPPGYVGYEEGGLLVNKIRQQPYAIVLFDEIEKAHPSVFDTFLQILDEGKLTDKLGNVGNFSNAVILFTSNIGAEYIINSFTNGNVPQQEQLLEKMTPFFRPEFLARITEIVPFAPISEENVLKIFELHTQPIAKQLKQQKIEFELESNAKTWLAMQGFSPKYGVRPLKNMVRSGIRKPLSRLIVQQTLQPNHKVIGQLKKDDLGKDYIYWHIQPI